jgi:uncharacterized protein (TIGR02145 family)
MKKIINFLLLAVVVFTASCISELPWDNPGGENNGNDAQVTLRLQTPGGFNAPKSTRGLTFAQENQIEDIYVLVFNNASPNVLIDIKKAKVSSQSTADPTGGISGVATFTVTMLPNTGAGATESSKLVVLANVQSILETTIGTDDTSASIGNNYTDVMSAIHTTISEKMYTSGGTIPMWGETEQIVIAPGNNNQTLRLMRAIARIDVGIGSPTRTASTTSDEWTWSGLERDGTTPIPFELQEVYVISPSNRFAVIPDVTLLSAGNPTLPTGTGKFALVQSESFFRFSGDDIAGVTNNRGGWTSRSIYIPEADVKINAAGISGDADHTNRIAVIMGGDFNSSGTTTYYRVDFAPDGRNLVNVLRNHLYQFNIVKVSGAGYPTVKEAYESMAMNMEVEIIDWDEEELNDIEFEGNNYFSIARREVVFSPFGGLTERVNIKTNVADFSMWELSGTATNEIQANGNLTFTSGNFAYQYTLTKTGSDTYLLEIYNPFNNVTNSPGDRKEQWQIRAGRMRIAFDVSQQWTNLYISVVDGSSARLFPEGTYGTSLPINIMSLVPVAINVTYSSGSGWVDLGDISGLTTASGSLFSARLGLTVPVFQYGAGLDGEYNRTATVTITPQGQPSVSYTIIQESPYIIFNPNTSIINIQRPATPPSTPTSTGITVITNILPADLSLARTANIGLAADAALVQLIDPPGLEHVDALRPRYGRFTVRTDLTGTLLPTPGFGAEFSVTPEVGKYGDLAPTAVKIAVPPGLLNFNIFWWQGSFNGGTTFPWNLTRYADETSNFVFPWNTTQVDFDVVSNVGLAKATSVTGNGILNSNGSETVDGAGNTQYPYSFLLNNQNFNAVGNYSLVFNTVDASPNIELAFDFTQGVQIWQRTNPAQTEIAYIGLTASPITVTNNVEWNAVVSPAAATWLTLQMNNAGTYNTPATATDMVRNDRFTAPVAFGGNYSANLTTVLTTATPLNISVANVTTLNPAWAPSRSGIITFTNLDLAATGATTGTPITVRQWAPVLTHSSNNIPATIPAASAGYQVTANTNLQGWGVRVYSGTTNTGTPLVSQAFGTGTTINANTGAGMHTTSFTMPANAAATARMVSIYLYCTEFPGAANEILVGTWSQEATAVTLTVSPGTLSFTAAANGGGNQNITVTTNNPNWTVSSNQAWATVPSGAQTGSTLSVGINAANPTTTARTATITVTAGGVTQTVTVTQAAAAVTLTVSPGTLSFTAAANGGGNQNVTVTTNNPNWTVSSNQAWATVPSGNQTGTTFSVGINAANTSTTARTTTITVTAGSVTQTVTVTQAAAAATLTVTPATMSFTSAANGGGAQTATVTRNTPNYTVSSNQTWATVPSGAQTAGTFNVTITSANTASTARTATITVSSPGATNRTIQVTQAAAGILIGSTRWAPANLNGSRIFAANQQAFGRLYQWGTIGTTGHDWPLMGAVTTWNSSNARVGWTAATNPCPDGWRLPTQAELHSLGSGTWTSNWNSTGVAGRVWGSGADTLFLPASGWRTGTAGQNTAFGDEGHYWASTPRLTTDAVYLLFSQAETTVSYSKARSNAQTIRCVGE